MSIWVHAFCRKSIGSVRPEDVAHGVERRLTALTYLLLPEEEEDPGAVLKRLRVTSAGRGAELRRLELHYRRDPGRFILGERWSNPRAVAEEVEERLEMLRERREPATEKVREHLRATLETFAFQLKASDARGMGWPIAISAAAELCEHGDGLIHADGSGWMVPTGIDVDLLLSE